MRVVLTESSPLQLKLLKEKIQKIIPDAEISGFWNIDEAIEYEKGNPCDVLITEIELYRCDKGGISLAEIVKEKNPNVKRIFATVCDANEYHSELLKLQPYGYLTKTYTEAELTAELKSLVN